MKPENHTDEELQKILALKRHEQPPPRFFHGLSEKIIDQLHQPEAPPTWWQRMGLDFDAKPVLVCVAGVGVSGLLVYGLISSPNMPAPAPLAADSSQNSTLPVSPIGAYHAQSAPGFQSVQRPEDMPGSVEPVMALDASSGNRFTIRPKPASFSGERGGK